MCEPARGDGRAAHLEERVSASSAHAPATADRPGSGVSAGGRARSARASRHLRAGACGHARRRRGRCLCTPRLFNIPRWIPVPCGRSSRAGAYAAHRVMPCRATRLLGRCELFTAWGWKSGNPDLEGKVPTAPFCDRPAMRCVGTRGTRARLRACARNDCMSASRCAHPEMSREAPIPSGATRLPPYW